MRCSSCEPLLDAYLEATLRAGHMRDVAAHLRECLQCEALLAELRVIDALLETARPHGTVAADFTAAVVSATPAAPPRARRGLPLWVPVLAYLAAAWLLAGLAAIRLGGGLLAPLAAAAAWEHRAAGAIGAAVRVLAPATPMAAAAVTAVLLVDLVLLAALLYGYRRVRPLISIYLARGPRP